MVEPVTQQLIFVLGMHRSGTSALTRLLNLHGCHLLPELTRSNQFNERGYWESLEVQRISDAMLASAQSSWFDHRPVRYEAVSEKERQAFSGQIAECLALLFKDAGAAPGVIKDPRISRLYPAWDAAARTFGARTSAVIPVRNPLEVAESLAYRDNIDESYSIALWLRHLLDAERYTRTVPRSFVLFGALLDNPQAQLEKISTDLNRPWPVDWKDAAEEAERFISSDLRHHAKKNEDLGRFGPIGELALALLGPLADLAEGRAGPDVFEAIDDCYHRMNDLFRVFQVSEPNMVNRHLANQRALGTLAPADSDKLSASLQTGLVSAAAGLELARAQTGLQNSERKLDAITERLAGIQAELKAARESEKNMVGQLESAGKASQVLEARLQVTETALENAVSELEKKKAHITSLTESAENLNRKIEFAELSRHIDTVRLEQTVQAQLQRELDVRQRDKQIARQDKALHQVRHEFQQTRSALLEAQARCQKQSQEIAALTGRLLDWESVTGSGFGQWGWSWLKRFVHLGKARELRRSEKVIRASGLFDEAWYLTAYPDIADSGVPPLRHFVRHGAMEGRNPSATFDCAQYRRQHPETDLLGVNPLVHALQTGAIAGRK